MGMIVEDPVSTGRSGAEAMGVTRAASPRPVGSVSTVVDKGEIVHNLIPSALAVAERAC